MIPITIFDKRNTATSNNIDEEVMLTNIVTSLLFFQFMANLEQSENWIPDSWSLKLTFLLIVTIYSMENKHRTKKSLTQLILLLSVKVLFFEKKKTLSFLKKCWHQQNLGVLVLKGIFSKTLYMCVLTIQL